MRGAGCWKRGPGVATGKVMLCKGEIGCSSKLNQHLFIYLLPPKCQINTGSSASGSGLLGHCSYLQTGVPHSQHTAVRGPLDPCKILGVCVKVLPRGRRGRQVRRFLNKKALASQWALLLHSVKFPRTGTDGHLQLRPLSPNACLLLEGRDGSTQWGSPGRPARCPLSPPYFLLGPVSPSRPCSDVFLGHALPRLDEASSAPSSIPEVSLSLPHLQM